MMLLSGAARSRSALAGSRPAHPAQELARTLLHHRQQPRRPALNLVEHRGHGGTSRGDGTSMPTRWKRRRLARLLTRVMMRRTPSCRPSSDGNRLRSSLSMTHTSTSLRPMSSLSSSFDIGAVTLQHERLPTARGEQFAARVRSRSIECDLQPRDVLLQPRRQLEPTSPPPMIVIRCFRASGAPLIRCGRPEAPRGYPSRGPYRPARERLSPRGMNSCSPRRTATTATMWQMQIGDGVRRSDSSTRYSTSWMAPSAKLSASSASGRADDALHVCGKLRLRPDHAIDAESASPPSLDC